MNQADKKSLIRMLKDRLQRKHYDIVLLFKEKGRLLTEELKTNPPRTIVREAEAITRLREELREKENAFAKSGWGFDYNKTPVPETKIYSVHTNGKVEEGGYGAPAISLPRATAANPILQSLREKALEIAKVNDEIDTTVLLDTKELKDVFEKIQQAIDRL